MQRKDTNRRWIRSVAAAALAVLLTCSVTRVSLGYSVLTHEAIIDTTWDSDIKPLLLKRFPDASKDQLREAHAHAYGGAIIQDMGYYPFGSKLFSDLTHYVRSGDFVEALIRDSRDLNEYAFALGALCHYSADNTGHPMAVNPSVPILFPKLGRKYGRSVTYAEDPAAHVRTEFGFDVVQVAHGHYASEDYHDFIGFSVSKPLLERAFQETYGIELKSIFISLDLALGTYRYSVNTVIPSMTKVAWKTHEKEIQADTPGITRQKFVYRLPRASYRKEFGGQYQRPGFFPQVLSVIFRIVPKVGPLKGFQIKPSTPETEKLFAQSFKETVNYYRELLGQVQKEGVHLQDRDFDTGKPVTLGEYPMADKAYGELLDRLARHKFENVAQDLRQNIVAFYGDSDRHVASKKGSGEWQRTVRELNELRSSGTNAGADGVKR